MRNHCRCQPYITVILQLYYSYKGNLTISKSTFAKVMFFLNLRREKQVALYSRLCGRFHGARNCMPVKIFLKYDVKHLTNRISLLYLNYKGLMAFSSRLQ